VFPAIVFSSCASAGGARQNTAAFADIQRQEWHLSEIRSNTESVRLNRPALDAAGFSGVFTITFEDGRVSGAGAPNRFFGPYTGGKASGSGGDLSIGLLGHTLMAAIFEPEELQENEYFHYLSSVTSWELREGMLELATSSNDGSKTVLVFTLE